MPLKLKYEIQKRAAESVKEIVQKMIGLSEEGFVDKFYQDPQFRKGFDTLVEFYIQAKSDVHKEGET
ncbi:hypothetical protein [Bacillus sp. AFS055030]|uniref:hypothetical protein n=1 Tax=Bacillus sp. AFS055030 TaxID=2033507 RepID=UPI000BFE9DB5|nr:hypothetical protein [Bacillus sp. AFS055030]PGL73222.1 hypothetical protein CN925_00790 [Bacillus sp. AFS055030]